MSTSGIGATLSARELEATSIIGLWLEIHGGDPPQNQEQVATIAGQIIANLATFAFGMGSAATTDAIISRLGLMNVQVKQGGTTTGATGGSTGIKPDYRIVQGGGYSEIIYPGVPGGPPIIVKVPHETHT